MKHQKVKIIASLAVIILSIVGLVIFASLQKSTKEKIVKVEEASTVEGTQIELTTEVITFTVTTTEITTITTTEEEITEEPTFSTEEKIEEQVYTEEEMPYVPPAIIEEEVEEVIATDSDAIEEETEEYVSGDYDPADFIWMGVIYWGGYKWTYYSQRVLPGGGLNIPGRYVDEDGFVCDQDGYICLASSDHEKGSVILTPFGKYGKVYDCGCASGTLDCYCDW